MKIKLIIAALIGALTGAAVTASKANKVIKDQHNALQKAEEVIDKIIVYVDCRLSGEEAHKRLMTDLEFFDITKDL